MANKKRDDEKGHWLAVGILFTVFLFVIDIWYSSYGQMAGIAKVLLILAHIVLGGLWFVVMAKFNDPVYDVVRKFIVGLSVILSLIVGIHHASSKEDKQVIIDANENKLK